jgi:hypothetical protein
MSSVQTFEQSDIPTWFWYRIFYLPASDSVLLWRLLGQNMVTIQRILVLENESESTLSKLSKESRFTTALRSSY